MEKFTIKEFEFLRKLAKEFPSNYTIEDILARDDLSPYTGEVNIPIGEVQFSISGIIKDGYESSGNTRVYSGTIKEIIKDLINDEDFEDMLKEIEVGTADKKAYSKVKDEWTKEEIKSLANFFLGKRKDEQFDDVKSITNREVTQKEIIEYIEEIELPNDFGYNDTVLGW